MCQKKVTKLQNYSEIRAIKNVKNFIINQRLVPYYKLWLSTIPMYAKFPDLRENAAITLANQTFNKMLEQDDLSDLYCSVL